MAAQGAPTQALLGAFTFGSVVYAASAALVLYVKGHGSAVFRDSQRLVLVSFLISSALWATIDFVTLLFNTSGSSLPCQIGVIVATVFDQLARFSIEQFLLWALNNNGGKLSVVQLIPQILVLLRFLAGAVFVGFTRPQTDDFCVATTSALPVGTVVIGLDVVIIMALIQKAYSSGPNSLKTTDPERIKAITAVLLGLGVWTASSIVMMLGLTTIPPVTRTAVPAAGLLILIVFVTTGAWTLVTSRKSGSGMPEAPSPRRINISRDISTADSDFPPSRYEDLKDAAIRSSRTFINPRDVPRVKDENSIGFPFSLDTTQQQQPMRPPRASTMGPSNLDRSVSKRGMFGFGQVAPAGKPIIGRPILQNIEEGNPLSKIQVVDLEQAALAEKQRRERMQGLSEEAANRSAVTTTHLTVEEGMKRAVSTKRKEVASMSSRQSVLQGGLQPESTGSTTSAQLSPAGDETRRRSPRPSPPLEENSKAWPSAVSIAKSMNGWPINTQDDTRPVTVLLQNNIPQPIQRPGIRPSRMLPPSPDTPPQEPAAKTPLQRRPTIGLPGNPRARTVAIPEVDSQHKTIMFVNNIEYHDPAGVESIIRNATQSMKPGPGRDRTSVVNRPRPIPRKPADSPHMAQLMDPSHRRSKSGGSLIGRKSIFNSTAGSPTKLPPLPIAPKSAGLPARPHPNSTKSMTFDEKVALLFPNPPSAKQIKRRSSVPELPPIPQSFMNITPSPTEKSRRTTKTEVESVLEVDEIQPKDGVVNTKNEAGRMWLDAFEGDAERKRRSSMVLPSFQVRASAWTETTDDDRTQYDDGMTNWSSMNSPEIAVGVPVRQIPGLPAAVRLPPRQEQQQDAQNLIVAPVTNNRATTETLPIMLDTWTSEQIDSRRSWLLEDESVSDGSVNEFAEEPELPKPAAPEPRRISQGQWHRRVGDECPAFSECMEKTKSRKTPPTPLSLSTPTKKAIIIHSEPSPLESPEHALKAIQAQLKKLEEPDVVSNETPSKRLELLENLEKEMGAQQDHWKEMKHDIGRDSISSVQTSSPAVKRGSMASIANIVSERRASRLSRMTKAEEPSARNSMRDSVSPQMSKWQKRLTEAHMEYLDARLVRESSVNFLQLSRAQLASPTPPDSDESDSELPPISSQYSKETPEPSPEQPKAMLWTQKKAQEPSTSLLWNHVPKEVAVLEAPLPGLSDRPAQRKELAPLKIESTQLWRKPYTDACRSTSGLWRPVWASAAPPAEPIRRASLPAPAPPPAQTQKAPRPVTQRPPRRNKRVTLLPDIIENPEPLPNKRGTLGIFQFPWGEKSDTASIQPRMMAMPGTMTSGGPAMKNEVSEYSASSFFDDYDEEEDEDLINEVNSEDEAAGDDSFDETTLWEIASLLKIGNGSSTDSLLSMAENSATEEYLEELQSNADEEDIVIGIEEPRELIFDQTRDSAALESTTLLMLEETYQDKTPSPAVKPVARVMVGLPANPRPAASVVESSALEVTRHIPQAVKVETVSEQGLSSGLWNPPVTWDKSSSLGLFTIGSGRVEFRTTSEDPAAQYMIRKPRPAEKKPLDTLASTELWSIEAAFKPERNWIAGVKQETPVITKVAIVSSGLWQPPVEDKSSDLGLFTVNSGRTVFRTTTEEPAAQLMVRKPRPAEKKPLANLVSTELWTVVATAKPERNWILGVAAITKTTVVSSGLWQPPVQDKSSDLGLFTINSGRTVFRTTTEEPAAQVMVRKPRAPELKPLDKLTSTQLWTSASSKSNQHNWIKPKYSRPQFTIADWAAALKSAVLASYPPVKYQRPVFTSDEWDAALEEAISASYPPKRTYDASVRHPVFFTANLITKSEWFHPAATGYTYDIANIHPAFFGSLAITCPEDQVHPAFSAYASKKLRRQRSKAARRESSASASHSRSRSLPSLAIQAQIEALEQERLFVERAAKEDYNRRISSYTYTPDPVPAPAPAVFEEEEEPIIPTVECLQRRLSQRIRDSLVLPKPITPVSIVPSSPVRAAKPTEPKMLWTAPVKKSASQEENHGLWSSNSVGRQIPEFNAEEDVESMTRRNKNRKQIQKKARRVEILGQIAAVKRGENPFQTFEGMKLWNPCAGTVFDLPVIKEERDWLHSVCYVKRRKSSNNKRFQHHERKMSSASGSKVILRF
ncbi:hypothetical protein QBC38DRAFT_386418 [Podospora fimiseda]|uniref:Uncharacterized protein n=1 Tax=Podospora fimiseda TaxID=252190 RepID=A0AAN7BU08_9PEZI|nr:hypothetical protein QBC38DRAFT_386418 [Podospora fimiseda]